MGVRTALLTRNSRRSVEIVCRLHDLCFDAAVTREDCRPKPDPQGVFLAAERIGVPPSAAMMVGDYEFDILAGKNAGCVTVLYSPDGRTFTTTPDFAIRSMAELPDIIASLECL